MPEIIIHSTELDTTHGRLTRVSKQRPIFPGDKRNLREMGQEAEMLVELEDNGKLTDPNLKTLNGVILELKSSENEAQNKTKPSL